MRKIACWYFLSQEWLFKSKSRSAYLKGVLTVAKYIWRAVNYIVTYVLLHLGFLLSVVVSSTKLSWNDKVCQTYRQVFLTHSFKHQEMMFGSAQSLSNILYAWHNGFLDVANCLESCCCVIRDTCVYALTRQAQQQQQYRSHTRRGCTLFLCTWAQCLVISECLLNFILQ